MNETVEYILRIQDQMSGSLKRIEENTQHMNKGMEHAKGMVSELKGAFVEFLAVDKLFEWGKEAFGEYQKAAEGNAQLEATLKSTSDAIGFSKQQLDAQALSLSRVSLNTKGAITSMQSVLATFTSIKGETFKQTQQAVLDLSAKMGGDLQGSAIQVGKAIQDPVKGVAALHRVGVNFNQTQMQMVKNLVATGHAAQAQQIILKELNTEFGGSAAAAAKANPWKVMLNGLEEKMVRIGGMVNKMMMGLEPIINKVFNLIDVIFNSVSGGGFGNMFKEVVSQVGQVVDLLASVLKEILPSIISMLRPIMDIFKVIFNTVMAIIRPIISALQPAFKAIAAVVKMIANEFKFMAPVLGFIGNIIGTILGFLIRVASAVIMLIVKFDEWLMKSKLFQGIWVVIRTIFDGISKAVTWIVDKIEKLFGLKGGSTTSTDTNPSDENAEAGADTSALAGGTGPSNSPSDVMSANQPKEAKLTNINIKIDTLAKLDIHTTTLGASIGQIKEMVAAALLGAVNNTQLQVSAGR